MVMSNKVERAPAPTALRIGVTMVILGVAATIVLGLLHLAAIFIIAEVSWFAASFVLIVTGIMQTKRTPPISHDPEKHPNPPQPFHGMPVQWGSVPTRTADNALQVVRELFRPKRERD